MTDPSSTPPPPPPLRRRIVWIAPAILIGLLLVVAVWTFIRGTWATTDVRNPGSSQEGVVAQLILAPDGRKEVRCARVVDAAPDAVWATVTGYDRFAQVFPRLTVTRVVPQDTRVIFSGEVDAGLLGSYAFEAKVTHDRQRGTASWDQPSGSLAVNRGRWVVQPLDPGRTLLVYELDLEVKGVPNFLPRALLLHELPKFVNAAAKDAARP